ncbi:hypothetical protein DV738_g2719, partial [Chaetothyriales sp. CBS 135597]
MVYHALIRTHHISSRKKVAVLKAAAKKLQCFALLRCSGVPGVMYVQGESKAAVQSWVDTVHRLRYKDYQLVAPVSEACGGPDCSSQGGKQMVMLGEAGVLEEVERVKDMALRIVERGDPKIMEWWRKAMGFVG